MTDRNAPIPSGRVPVQVEGSTPPVIHRGEPIYTSRFLPDLPPPKTVVAGRTDLHIDETSVSLWVLSKPTLDWLGSQILKWRDEDPSEENKRQLVGIVDAVEQRIKQMTDDSREEFRRTVISEIIIPYINHLLHGEGKVVSFTPDIDRLSADIVLDSLKSFGRVKIHVPELRFHGCQILNRPLLGSHPLCAEVANAVIWGGCPVVHERPLACIPRDDH
jgi:hypothetical protein